MRSSKLPHFPALLVAATILLPPAPATSAQQPCRPPAGFKEAPHPAIASDQLVSHTEEIVIDRPFAIVSAAMKMPLEKTILRSNSLPGVAGDYMLTPGDYGPAGSHRIVCLTDGSTTEEESLAQQDTPTASHFRYMVWNYTTPKARPIAYGIGDFHTTALDPTHTRILWTYAFQLKPDIFPGDLGAPGRWLFRIAFLDHDYAAMMASVLQGYRQTAETIPIPRP